MVIKDIEVWILPDSIHVLFLQKSVHIFPIPVKSNANILDSDE